MIKFNVKLLQQLNIFFFKCFLLMMFPLSQNIIYHGICLRFTLRKCAKSTLPFKTLFYPTCIIDKRCGIGFHISHQIRNCQIRPHAHNNMHMIRHTINGV